jgi:hypothetical protein
MPRLRAAVLRGSFAALVPEAPPPGLAGLEERLVKSLRPLARDPDPGDAARRGPLTERQAMNLTRWGYPFVLSDFSFHMSLAYTAEESFLSVLEGYLPPEALAPFPLDSVSLCLQTGPGRPFRVLADFPLRGAAGR